jgi:hypothetical protein
MSTKKKKMVKRVDNDMRRLNDIKLWFPYIGNNIRIRYIQPGVAILQTPDGVCQWRAL